MTDFESAKNRAVSKLVGEATANVLDTLAERAEKQLPAESLFTREEVGGLLRGMAEKIREEAA